LLSGVTLDASATDGCRDRASRPRTPLSDQPIEAGHPVPAACPRLGFGHAQPVGCATPVVLRRTAHPTGPIPWTNCVATSNASRMLPTPRTPVPITPSRCAEPAPYDSRRVGVTGSGTNERRLGST
jgi:hypothetical protein